MMSERSLWVRMKDNNRRRYWIGIVNMVFLFLFMPLRFLGFCMSNLKYFESVMHPDFLLSATEMLCRYELGPNEYMLAFFVASAILSGVEGYSYLYQMRKVDMLHSQPVSCKKRFYSIYLNGAFYVLIPYLINTILTMLIGGVFHLMTWTLLGAFMLTVLYHIMAFLAFYHTVILAVVLTGNFIACFCGIAAIMGIEWAFRSLFYEYCVTYLKTFSNHAEYKVMNPVLSVLSIYLQGVREAKYPLDSTVDTIFSAGTIWLSSYKNILNLTAISILTLVIAYLAYYHRPVEAAGKPVVIEPVKPIAKILAVVLLSLSMGRMLSAISGNNVWLVVTGLVIGAVVAHCVMEIIYEARISAVTERLWQFGVGVMIVAVMFICFKADILRYDQSIPKSENVESFAVLFSPQESDTFYVGDNKIFRYIEKNMFIKDTDLLEQLAAADYFHQTGEKVLHDEQNEYSTADVIYRMNNGTSQYRTYYIDMDRQEKLMDAILAKKEYQQCIYPLVQDDFFTEADTVNLVISGVTKEYASLSRDLLEELKEAYRQDLMNYDYTMIANSRQYGMVYVSDKQEFFSTSYAFPVYDSFEHVNEVLENNQMPISEIPLPEQISKIELSYTPESSGEIVATTDDAVITIWEQNKIEKVLEYAEETTYGSWWKPQDQYYNNIVMIATMDSGNYAMYNFTKEKGIPDWLKKELNMAE